MTNQIPLDFFFQRDPLCENITLKISKSQSSFEIECYDFQDFELSINDYRLPNRGFGITGTLGPGPQKEPISIPSIHFSGALAVSFREDKMRKKM